MEDSSLGAKELQRRIKDKHKVEVPYKRVYAGKELAHTELFGSWDSSFNNLYTFKAEIESCCPGSFFVIDHHPINDEIRFNRIWKLSQVNIILTYHFVTSCLLLFSCT